MRLDNLPGPLTFRDWKDWGSVLIQRLAEFGVALDRPGSDLLLASTATGLVSATTPTYFSWDRNLHLSGNYFHATGTTTITFAKKGAYVVNADLCFTATTAVAVTASIFVNGLEYGTLGRAFGEGTSFLRCPIIGAYVKVIDGDVLQIGAQGSLATVAMAISRLWVVRC